MAKYYFTIQASCSFNCEVEVSEKMTKRELQRKIASRELFPNILSENTYNFQGYTAKYIQFEDEEEN